MHEDYSVKLTPRQRQVAALARSGASNKEIAKILGVEASTVKSLKGTVAEKYARAGIDLHAGTLIEQKHRFELLQKIAQRAWAEASFGLACK